MSSGIRRAVFFLLTSLTFLSGPVLADDAKPLCVDRPGKNTSACVTDSGRVQLELNAYDETFQSTNGTDTDLLLLLNPTLKYGLSDTLDIEASFAPVQSQRTRAGASDMTVTGHGDVYLRGKWMFTGDGDKGFTAVAEPYVKLATATQGLGNGALEGGLMVPFGYDWGNGWSLSSTPEADVLLDASGHGRHAALVNVVELNREVGSGITLGAELWNNQNFDPAGTVSQSSFDLDVAWLTDKDTQLDVGTNVGLNHATPDLEIYAGISRRF
jgi:hypothetical protein